MLLLDDLAQSFTNFMNNTFAFPSLSAEHVRLSLNTDQEKQTFGDFNSTAALGLSKLIQRNPRDIATTIARTFTHPAIARIEVAGPGFLNFFLTSPAFQQLAQELLTHQDAAFQLPTTIQRKKISLEFVSANPTGPLHLGHGRGGIIGDVLGNILRYLGHEVTKEFYINDAGSQITKLGISLKVRCQQEAGIEIALPEQGYAGNYLIDLAKQCIAEYGVAVLGEKDSFFEEYAKEHLLAAIKKTLLDYGISFDVWFSEKSLHTSGAIQNTIKLLEERGFITPADGALWFASTTFGDDKDRVVRKASGELTYVAADAAYLRNKAERGFDELIMVLGHDHHGYVQRLEGLRQALGITAPLSAILYQLVKMKADGKQVRMSKRAGTMVTLQEVINEVGSDVARFFYLNRKADAQLEFDLDLALTKTEENPVYYIQYAYVRTKSIFNKANELGELQDIGAQDAVYLTTADDQLLLKKIASLKSLLEHISITHQTHLLTYYLLELAQLFHAYYARNRIIQESLIAQSRGRLLLVRLVQQTFERCLKLLGISCPEAM